MSKEELSRAYCKMTLVFLRLSALWLETRKKPANTLEPFPVRSLQLHMKFSQLQNFGIFYPLFLLQNFGSSLVVCLYSFIPFPCVIFLTAHYFSHFFLLPFLSVLFARFSCIAIYTLSQCTSKSVEVLKRNQRSQKNDWKIGKGFLLSSWRAFLCFLENIGVTVGSSILIVEV